MTRVELPWRTAMVTGASSGIGEAVARVLAANGVERLVLVARRADRLDRLAAEARERWGCRVEVLVADLASDDPVAGLPAVEARLAGEDEPIDLLVNNAGLGTGGRFVDVGTNAYDHQIRVNVVALARLTHVAAAAMAARGGGGIVNVASIAAYQPTPGYAVYAAGKAFVLSLSEALHEELRSQGVTVTAVCPGFTSTEFVEAAGGEAALGSAPAWVWMRPATVAVQAVAAAAAGRAVCVPGRGYRLVALGSDLLPRGPKRWLLGRLQGVATAASRR